MSLRCSFMQGTESGFTLWEVCLGLTLLMGWSFVVTPFIIHGNERVARLERTVRVYERLQGEVLREAEHPTGVEQVCEEELCLPTL